MKIMMLTQVQNDNLANNERVNIKLNELVVANKANRDENGNIVEGFHEEQVDNITMSKKQLCFQLYNADERIAMLRGVRGKSFTIINLAALLTGAEIEIEAVKHSAGEVDEESGFIHENDSITHHIKKVKLSEKAEMALTTALSQAYDLLG